MADETTDVSNKMQCNLVIKWLDKDFKVTEDCHGLYNLSTTADSIVAFIKDVLFILRYPLLCGMVSTMMAVAQWLELEVM